MSALPRPEDGPGEGAHVRSRAFPVAMGYGLWAKGQVAVQTKVAEPVEPDAFFAVTVTV